MMAEYFSTLRHEGGANSGLFAGVIYVSNKAVAAICVDKCNPPVSTGLCKGRLELAKPEAIVALIRNAIDNAIHVSRIAIQYCNIVGIVISVPGQMDEWSAGSFIDALKSIEPRLGNTHIFIVSEPEAEMHRVSKGGGPGLVITSGPPVTVFAQNTSGECDRVGCRGLEEKLAWEMMNLIVKNTSATGGFASLQRRFFNHFHVSSKEELADNIGFFDPIERTSIKREILAIAAEEALIGNTLALNFCIEAARRYFVLSEPIISHLSLGREIFPISLQGGIFTVNPIFGRLYLTAVKHIAPNTYIMNASDELGVREAWMAMDLFSD